MYNKILITNLKKEQNGVLEERHDTFINCTVEPSRGFVVGNLKVSKEDKVSFPFPIIKVVFLVKLFWFVVRRSHVSEKRRVKKEGTPCDQS